MARALALLLLATLLGGCVATLDSGSSKFVFDPAPSRTDGGGSWYDGTGPRGNSGGGP